MRGFRGSARRRASRGLRTWVHGASKGAVKSRFKGVSKVAFKGSIERVVRWEMECGVVQNGTRGLRAFSLKFQLPGASP